MDFSVQSVKDRMIASLRSKTSWSKILFYSTNQRLIDAFAEEINNLAFYDEYLTRETKWQLAQNVSSLVTQAPAYNYALHRKIGAKGDIRFGVDERIYSDTWATSITYDLDDVIYYDDILYISLQNSNTSNQPDTSPAYWSALNIKPTVNVIIPKYTTFSNESGDYFYCTTDNEVLTTIDNYVDIPVVEGTPKSTTVSAVGENYEEVIIYNDSIENVVLDVYVNNVLWTKVDDLRQYTSTDQVYVIENLPELDGIAIQFGNNIFGKKLTVGDAVKINYVETTGAGGDVISDNIINTVVSSIYDANGALVESFVTNFEEIVGGNNYENIEDIRSNAPKMFQTGDRATSKPDYKVILEENEFIEQAVVWGEKEYNEDNGNAPGTFIQLQENLVNVSAFTPSGSQLSASQKTSIINYLEEFKSPTDILNFVDAVFIKMKFTIAARVSNRSYTLSEVKQNIIDTLVEEYSISNLLFFQPLYQSDYIALIDSVDGVENHNTTIELFLETTFNTAYEATITIPLYPIEPGTVLIYIKDNTATTPTWTKLAEDDGAGNFTPEAGYTLAGTSTINYNTGEGILNVTSGLTGTVGDYELKYYYQLTNTNLILNSRNQIFKIEEYDDITTSYTT